MKAKFFLFLFLVLYAPKVLSQAENNNWYYGLNAGLNFNTNNNTTSVLLDNSITEQLTSAGTVSNKVSGTLLFTTDGKFVYNKNFIKMTNSATGAINSFALGQSGLIVPSIANRNLYYVFSPTLFNGLLYSVVDMTQDNGLGDIDQTQKGQPMYDEFGSPFTLKSLAVTVVPNNLGNGYWVLYPTNNKLYTYRIDGNGFSPNPVTFTTLTFTFNQSDSSLGINRIKGSPDGSRIGITVSGNNFNYTSTQTRFYSFNNATGAVDIANEIALNSQNIRQLEFSTNINNSNIVFYDNIVYGTGGNYTANLYGRDLNSSNTSLLYSANNIFNTCLQRTPNNEIYFSFSPRYVSQVSNPSIYNSSVLVDLINGNPDNPNPLRYTGSYMPQLIPKLNCALYEDLKGNNITNNYTYQVSNRITTSSDYTVNENQTINLFAKDYIEFKANTHLKSNSTVWAKIQACPGSSGRMADENAIKNDAVSQSTNDLIIAPNPVTDFVLIKTSQTGFNKVTISSLDGKVVKTETVENTMEYSLNASGIAKGIYLISVTSKEGSLLTQKLIKN